MGRGIAIIKADQPDVRPVKESGELYQLFEDYTFELTQHNTYFKVTIPKDFQYDGASVPRIVWTLIGFLPDGIHRPAALIHDYMYENKGIIKQGDTTIFYTRKEADQIFHAILKYVGVKSWHARLAYIAVRALGGFYWRK